MKKQVLLLIVLSTLMSCGSDGDGAEISGRWKFTQIRYEVEATDPNIKIQTRAEAEYDTKEMRGKYIALSDKGYSNEYEGWVYVPFYVEGEKLYFKRDNGSQNWEYWKFKIQGNTFTFIYDVTDKWKRYYPDSGIERIIEHIDYTTF